MATNKWRRRLKKRQQRGCLLYRETENPKEPNDNWGGDGVRIAEVIRNPEGEIIGRKKCTKGTRSGRKSVKK